MSHHHNKPRIQLPKDLAEATKTPQARKKILDCVRESSEQQVKIINPEDFYREMNSAKESRVYEWLEEFKKNDKVGIDSSGLSYIVEQNLSNGSHRYKRIKDRNALLESVRTAEASTEKFIKLKEQDMNILHKKFTREDFFDHTASGDSAPLSGASATFPVRTEYSPIMGTPFYKQLYLYDYLLMHSKAFYYKNYSGIAKAIVDITRNFVIGRGFSTTIDDKKAREAWERYEDYSDIHQKIRHWSDELSTFGEIMVKKMMSPKGVDHNTVDPSTIWEIVTDPENINDVKYYHQQYNTQYQIYQAKDAPSSKYIIQHIPPTLISHYKVNCTTYEKRGRSDLLPAMLYLKYFEDYMVCDLIRKKNESAFIWDVELDGSDEDVAAYIAGTQSIADVPPGSENVHNKAIKRTPLSPQFSAKGPEETAKTILAYIAMSTTIPTSYFGFSGSGDTKASALVKTEPVAKKMEERRMVIEKILTQCFQDVMIYNGLDPDIEVEFNFPEIIEEDRTTKIQDTYLAWTNGTFSHETASHIVAKELNNTNYDYENEMKRIEKERKGSDLFIIPPGAVSGSSDGLTPDKVNPDDKESRTFDRSDTRKKDMSY